MSSLRNDKWRPGYRITNNGAVQIKDLLNQCFRNNIPGSRLNKPGKCLSKVDLPQAFTPADEKKIINNAANKIV
jgi:hypothetical protein